MPQLVPFYFQHQVFYVFLGLMLLLSFLSKYMFPNMLSRQLGRFIMFFIL